MNLPRYSFTSIIERWFETRNLQAPAAPDDLLRDFSLGLLDRSSSLAVGGMSVVEFIHPWRRFHVSIKRGTPQPSPDDHHELGD